MNRTSRLILILAFFASSVNLIFAAESLAEALWPPKLGEKYPDLALRNHHGQRVNLSRFSGKVLLIEPIGMSCPACQAFSGGNKYGGFAGVRPQKGLDSIEDYFPRYAGGLSLGDKDLIFIQILFYNISMKAPSLKNAKEWARHFKLETKSQYHVLYADESFINKATYNLIPGFQLVDKSFVLRFDSTGHHPKHNLFRQLLPAVPKLLKER
jgi:hypothetical protein